LGSVFSLFRNDIPDRKFAPIVPVAVERFQIECLKGMFRQFTLDRSASFAQVSTISIGTQRTDRNVEQLQQWLIPRI
jgi:hypothetical protein